MAIISYPEFTISAPARLRDCGIRGTIKFIHHGFQLRSMGFLTTKAWYTNAEALRPYCNTSIYKKETYLDHEII